MTVDFYVVGRRIKTIRKKKGISQEQLASEIGITKGHINHIESGLKNPSAEILIGIAATLSVPVDELLIDLDFPQKENLEVYELLTDCSKEEKLVFKELISFLKPVLKDLRK